VNPKRVVRFLGAQAHNLKGFDVGIPLNIMVAVTNVTSSTARYILEFIQSLLSDENGVTAGIPLQFSNASHRAR